jgi:hypothetical protein
MLSIMRTTVTLDPDAEQLIRQRMRRDKTSFKRALNDAIRDGCGGLPSGSFETEVAAMGRPTVDLDRALQVAGDLEDVALAARLRGGS